MADDAGNGAPEKRRKPQQKLTEADKELLREILRRDDAKVDGKIHVPTVCRLTGLSPGCVHNFISRDPYWASQTTEAKPDAHVPKETDLVDRDAVALPPGTILLSQTQWDEYQGLIRQNKKMLAKDWAALGMTEEAGARMEHYVTLGTAPVGQILRATTGQLVSNLELLDRVNKMNAERVLTGKIPEEIGKNGEARDPDEVAREWHATLFSGMDLQLKMFAHLHKAQALVARVMADLRKMNGGQAPTGKGTFGGFETQVSERAP